MAIYSLLSIVLKVSKFCCSSAGHTDGVVGGCISDVGRILATYSFDNTVRLWSLDSGACVRTVPLGVGVARIALSLDGWKLAVALASHGIVVIDLDHGTAPGGVWQVGSWGWG